MLFRSGYRGTQIAFLMLETLKVMCIVNEVIHITHSLFLLDQLAELIV